MVTIDLGELKEGCCIIVEFGKNDKRAVCMENNKLKIFELLSNNEM